VKLDVDRDAIRRQAARHGARDVRVFGSVARDEATTASDLDILVTMEPGRTLFDLIALEQDLRGLLGRRVDVISDAGLSPYLRSRILAAAVAL
jgi:predicted nucleotidyltransferase